MFGQRWSLTAMSLPPFVGARIVSRARIGLLGDPLRLALVLAHDVEPLMPLDDLLDVGQLVAGLDEKTRRVRTYRLVLLGATVSRSMQPSSPHSHTRFMPPAPPQPAS